MKCICSFNSSNKCTDLQVSPVFVSPWRFIIYFHHFQAIFKNSVFSRQETESAPRTWVLVFFFFETHIRWASNTKFWKTALTLCTLLTRLWGIFTVFSPNPYSLLRKENLFLQELLLLEEGDLRESTNKTTAPRLFQDRQTEVHDKTLWWLIPFVAINADSSPPPCRDTLDFIRYRSDVYSSWIFQGKNVHPAWQATWEKAEYFTGHTQHAAFLQYGQSTDSITDTITAPSIISLTLITCWTPSFIYNDVCASCWYPFALCERTTHQNTTMPSTFTRPTSHRCPSLFFLH